jgi:predicted GNAT family N-acyltransferase
VVSATRIGRLAVSKNLQGAGLGSVLLARALHKANENASVVCSSMVVVDTIDDRAVPILSGTCFYQTARVYAANLPMRTIVELKVS